MILRTGECPLPEARKRPGNGSDSNVTKNFSPFYSLSTQSFRLKIAFSETGFIQCRFFSIPENALSSNNDQPIDCK